MLCTHIVCVEVSKTSLVMVLSITANILIASLLNLIMHFWNVLIGCKEEL